MSKVLAMTFVASTLAMGTASCSLVTTDLHEEAESVADEMEVVRPHTIVDRYDNPRGGLELVVAFNDGRPIRAGDVVPPAGFGPDDYLSAAILDGFTLIEQYGADRGDDRRCTIWVVREDAAAPETAQILIGCRELGE